MGEAFPATSMPDRDWWTVLWPNPLALLEALGIKPGMTVLDLCCGDGYFTAPLAKLVAGKVYALDLDETMIEMARAEVDRQAVSVRQWIRADARDIADHLPENVDYVLMANTFHGVPDQLGLVQAVHSVLAPRGSFGIVNWEARPREETTVLGLPRGPKTEMRMTPADVAAIVEHGGFRSRAVIELPPYHYGIVFVAL
ncbi:class I SAM-dependent methyltransferase [Rhizobium hainanense]|uniref:Methyltransferase domain-containing protein n=1 Tax=Rhizobium hainanense TaxID=52131 RepID=A0A1C3USH5_9HYPH|nr:class I SAM-dependent methyltransferase [Rhizobium hainanense]SCB18384.1 Methyltransferase domain-containing protein [Rhizobium hainanense]